MSGSALLGASMIPQRIDSPVVRWKKRQEAPETNSGLPVARFLRATPAPAARLDAAVHVQVVKRRHASPATASGWRGTAWTGNR
ncbi:hypothetical protein CFAM422_002358 [Trichoderma lentiforme]|uniref:Uncharacterized protein n=1 Tax=Trichoderma lentiforme TaxID=1567552 RepID=A0A9P4XK76_9HYPO|nr:hypothetical protein CFAM422_002358 [Trichoderma lentiforme]